MRETTKAENEGGAEEFYGYNNAFAVASRALLKDLAAQPTYHELSDLNWRHHEDSRPSLDFLIERARQLLAPTE